MSQCSSSPAAPDAGSQAVSAMFGRIVRWYDPLNRLLSLGLDQGWRVLLARAAAGDTAGALEVIRNYWGGMLDFGATTFWEDFDLDWTRNAFGIDSLPVPGKDDIHGDFGKHCYRGLRHSLCHGWASAPCFWLSETLSGVRFLSPGGGELSVTPRLAGLQWMRIGIPTPRGPVTIEQEAGKAPEIRLPEGVRLVPQEPCC